MIDTTWEFHRHGIWSCRDNKYLKQYEDKFGNIYSRLNLFNKIYKVYINDDFNDPSLRFLFNCD